jgi:hypothetical protein
MTIDHAELVNFQRDAVSMLFPATPIELIADAI